MDIAVIKEKVITHFGSAAFERIPCDSKNELYKVIADKTYLLKVFIVHPYAQKQEVHALRQFKDIPEIPNLVMQESGEDCAWVLRDFVDGEPLSTVKSEELYFKAVDVLIHIHALPAERPNDRVILDSYKKKFEHTCERIAQWCPEAHKARLLSIVDDFPKYFSEIVAAANTFIHGDFVDRNIIVKDGALHIIDFESFRYAPGLEDFIFFVEELSNDVLKNKLVAYYREKTTHDKRLYQLLLLNYKLRVLGSNLRIRKGAHSRFEEDVESIYSLMTSM